MRQMQKSTNVSKIIANAEIHSNSQNYIIVILVVTPPCSKNTVNYLARDAAFELEAMSDKLYGGTEVFCYMLSS